MNNDLKSSIDAMENKIEKLKIYRGKVDYYASQILPVIEKLSGDELLMSGCARSAFVYIKENLSNSFLFAKNYHDELDSFYYHKSTVKKLYEKVRVYSELSKLERPLRHIISNIEKFYSIRDTMVFDADLYNTSLKSLIKEFDDLVQNLQISSDIAIGALSNCLDKISNSAQYLD